MGEGGTKARERERGSERGRKREREHEKESYSKRATGRWRWREREGEDEGVGDEEECVALASSLPFCNGSLPPPCHFLSTPTLTECRLHFWCIPCHLHHRHMNGDAMDEDDDEEEKAQDEARPSLDVANRQPTKEIESPETTVGAYITGYVFGDPSLQPGAMPPTEDPAPAACTPSSRLTEQLGASEVLGEPPTPQSVTSFTVAHNVQHPALLQAPMDSPSSQKPANPLNFLKTK